MILPVISFPAVAVSAPSRQINVVYDDSISMIQRDPPGNELVDTWSQAKYSMEVFAAMLGEKDLMSVYAMNDFCKSENANPKLQLAGSDGMNANVKKVYNMITSAQDTPFNTVKKAYRDLQKNKAEEKWLVVLTDGAFEKQKNVPVDPGTVSDFFDKKSKDVNVVFLGMGESAQKNGVITDEANNVFAYYTTNNSQILTKITEICTRVFNSNKLKINAKASKISTKDFEGVPMKELTVFAQGKDVKINGIIKPDGTAVKSSSQPVTVKVGDKATTNPNYKKCIKGEGLNGSLATFSDDFIPGDYKLDITGADTIEVYYKPNISIAAYLVDSKGEKVENLSELEAGKYTINFGLVKDGTNEAVGSSSLLKDVKYTATVENNGVVHDKAYKNGDKISLVEGDLKIDVLATYLDYNTVSTEIKNHIYKNKDVSFESVQNNPFNVTSGGIDTTEPMKLLVKLDGAAPTEEQWDKMELPNVKLAEHVSFTIDDFVVEKSEDEIGVFNVTLVIKGKPSTRGAYEDCELEASYDAICGSEKWSGESKVTMKISDSRSWLESHKGTIIAGAIILLILLVLLGYVPGVKHYLPKKLKGSPKIIKRSANPVFPDKNFSGNLTKNILSTFIPYKAQTGEIKFVPPTVAGIRPLKVKGIKNGRMAVTNLNDYRNKMDIKFRGNPITTQKTLESSAGLSITVVYRGDTYTCQTNM